MVAAFILSCLLLLLEVGPSHASGQPQAPQPLWSRGVNVSSTITTATATITTAAITTAPAKFRCDYRAQDPDRGIASPFCECGVADETQSWPDLTPSAWLHANDIYQQCAYTAAPASTVALPSDKTPPIDVESRLVCHVPLWATMMVIAYPSRIAVLEQLPP